MCFRADQIVSFGLHCTNVWFESLQKPTDFLHHNQFSDVITKLIMMQMTVGLRN